jgi:hypothetical protein
MKSFIKHFLLYIIFVIIEMIVNLSFEFHFEGKSIGSKIIIPLILIKIFYGWMSFLPLLFFFKLLISIIKWEFLQNRLIYFIIIGIIGNFPNYLLSKPSNYLPFSIIVNGVVFGLLYYSIFCLSFVSHKRDTND